MLKRRYVVYDCFATSVYGCKILTDSNCDNCAFYKTQNEFDEDAKKSLQNLKKLPKTTQLYIANKYFDGKAVWNPYLNKFL